MIMKKLTLNQAWTLCIKQWDCIIRKLDEGSTESLHALKMRCLEEQGHRKEDTYTRFFYANCFFCEYDEQHPGENACDNCPGRLISSRFHCENEVYDYILKPRKFHKKLLRMNKIRKQKK